MRAEVRLLTVGHGTLAQERLTGLLTAAGVRQVVDVRRHPGSKRHPHFARAAIERWLPDAGVAYRWVEDLGGRRDVPASSPDAALRNAAFRGYAAHMRSPGFGAALASVLVTAREARTAVMCAESLWWRCHRRLIADAASLLHGATIEHFLHDGRLVPHEPTQGVRRDGPRLFYDATGEPRLDLG
jgi:uncharacterized protein (DUF488 family)